MDRLQNFLPAINCDERFTLYFYDKSIGELSRQWDFGDNTTSSAASPVHVYSSPGIYITKLIITGTTAVILRRIQYILKPLILLYKFHHLKLFIAKTIL